MAAEDLVRQQLQAFNNHDSQAWGNGYAADAVLYDPQYPEPLRGRVAITKDVEDFIRAFPDMRFQESNVLISGDRIALEGTGTGTHQGPIEGPGGTIAPTNKRIEIAFATFLRLDGEGRIAEERRYYDQVSILMQLGVM